MKDRYLFKAKRKDNGEWVEGYLFKQVAIEDRIYFAIEVIDSTVKAYEIDVSTLCQYTGLTDKNGNKIWENDVVKRYNANGDAWRISKIVWADYSLNMGWCIEDVKSLTEYSSKLFKVGFNADDAEKVEVIGTKFDNPELLGG